MLSSLKGFREWTTGREKVNGKGCAAPGEKTGFDSIRLLHKWSPCHFWESGSQNSEGALAQVPVTWWGVMSQLPHRKAQGMLAYQLMSGAYSSAGTLGPVALT